MVLRMLAPRTAAGFLAEVSRLVAAHPHPLGPTLRLTVSVIEDGRHLGHADVDVTNLYDLGLMAGRRVESPIAEPAKPGRHLRLVGEAS